MKNNFVLRQFINIFLLLASTAAVMFIFLRDYDFARLFEAVKSANFFWLIMVLVCMVGFVGCEAWVLRITMRALGNKISFFRGLEYSFAGFFFSSITPSASGGQPMQIYYMSKDEIEPSSSMACLLVVLVEYQIAMVAFACAMSAFNLGTALEGSANMRYLLTFGGIVNVSAAIIFILLLFSGNTALKLSKCIFCLLRKINIISEDKGLRWEKKFGDTIKKYSNSSKILRSDMKVFAKSMVISMLQMFFYTSVTYCVYKSVGLKGHSWREITTLQSLLTVGSSAVPMPGSVGAAEGGFLHIFRPIFHEDFLETAMILTRGISFYMFTIISMIVCIYLHFRTTGINRYKVVE